MGFLSRNLRNFPDGQQVKSVLYDTPIHVFWEEGKIKGNKKWNQKPQVDVNVFTLEGKLDTGFSGAPVCYESSKKVVGVFTAKDDNYGYVIPIEIVLEKYPMTPTVRRDVIKTKEELRIFYDVEPNKLIGIRNFILSSLKHWIENWFELSERSKKRILLITGKPGTGKSWLAYRLTIELMNEHFSISKIDKGFDIHVLTGFGIQDKSETKDVKSQVKPVFILDDKGIAVGVVSTSFDANDIYDIIKSILPNDVTQALAGPMIFSMREENWNYIINGVKNRDKLDEQRLQEIVEIIELPPLPDEETEKLVESNYKIVDGKDPTYPKLTVTDNIKNGIIKESGGIPIIVKLFFDQKGSKADFGEFEITDADVNSINTDAKSFALQQIFNYYLSDRVLDDKNKASNTLAFVYFMIKKGSISVGHLRYIREKMEHILSNDIKDYLYLLDDKRSLPLFTTNNYGIVKPYHDSISEAVISVVEEIDNLNENVFKQTDIIRKINRLREIYTFINVKEEAENKFLLPYIRSLVDSMNHYFKNYLRFDRMKGGTNTISNYIAYNFLSIFIEFLNRVQNIS